MPQALFGGSDQSSSSQQTSQGGFRDLPPEIQDVFKQLATNAQQYIGPAGTQAYTPLPQTASETAGLNTISQGFAPTQQSIQSNIAMQSNPYDQSVIDEINRQAQGQNSVLQQSLNSAGQFGSNRGILGANDIDLSRLNQIGQFKQGQFNTSLNNALTTIPSLQAQSAQGQISAGGYQRQLAGQTSAAPITALQQIAQALGVLPTQSSQGQQSSSSSGSSNNGIFKSIPLFG